MLGDAFEKKDKKYVLVKMNYRNVNFKDYIIPFSDLPESAVAKSALNPKLRDLMQAITDSTSISKAMNYWQIDTEILNPSNIDQKLINEAKEFLSKIGDAIKIQDQIQQEMQKE